MLSRFKWSEKRRAGHRVTRLLGVFVRALTSLHRRKAKRAGVVVGRTGAVTFVQRFGGQVNLNVHFHLVCPDGAFEEEGEGRLRFHELPPPSDDEVLALVQKCAKRVEALIDPEEEPDDDSLLRAQAMAVQTRLWPVVPTVPGKPRCAFVEGYSVHADVRVEASDREGLERLCRYGARPAFAAERLERTESGQVAYRLKRPWPDGRTHLFLDPVAFLRKLAGIIPPPRAHLVRYHGLFGPHARLRATLIEQVPASGERETPAQPPRVPRQPGTPRTPTRLPWAELLKRVMALDVLACPCGGRRRVIAFITEARTVSAILRSLGLPEKHFEPAAARAPPSQQASAGFDYVEAGPDDIDPLPPIDS